MSFLNSSANHSKNTVLSRWVGVLLCCAGVSSNVAAATDNQTRCVAQSPRHRVALIELYTSEGCNSCPPADRWLATLPELGFDSSRVVPLAYHVDYWDYLGWHDRFAQSLFSARQRAAADRHGAKFVYTPQVLLNDEDIRSPWRSGNFSEQIREITGRDAPAKLSLLARNSDGVLTIQVGAAYFGSGGVDVFVAMTQDNLETRVRAGENAGKTLKHRFVVRQFWGPLETGSGSPLSATLSAAIPRDATVADVAVSAFVQDRSTGEVLQALRAPICAD